MCLVVHIVKVSACTLKMFFKIICSHVNSLQSKALVYAGVTQLFVKSIHTTYQKYISSHTAPAHRLYMLNKRERSTSVLNLKIKCIILHERTIDSSVDYPTLCVLV